MARRSAHCLTGTVIECSGTRAAWHTRDMTPRTWLPQRSWSCGGVAPLVTATNVGRNAARGTRRYRRLLERLPRPADQPDIAEVALDAHAFGVDARLRAGLRALNETDAHLLVLVAFEGYPVAAAAEQLELSLPAARTRLHRVRARLREQLGDQLPDAHLDDQGGIR